MTAIFRLRWSFTCSHGCSSLLGQSATHAALLFNLAFEAQESEFKAEDAVTSLSGILPLSIPRPGQSTEVQLLSNKARHACFVHSWIYENDDAYECVFLSIQEGFSQTSHDFAFFSFICLVGNVKQQKSSLHFPFFSFQ